MQYHLTAGYAARCGHYSAAGGLFGTDKGLLGRLKRCRSLGLTEGTFMSALCEFFIYLRHNAVKWQAIVKNSHYGKEICRRAGPAGEGVYMILHVRVRDPC